MTVSATARLAMSSTVTSAARPGCAEIMCSTASPAEVGRPRRKATSIRAASARLRAVRGGRHDGIAVNG
jgi:hypothetical protein